MSAGKSARGRERALRPVRVRGATSQMIAKVNYFIANKSACFFANPLPGGPFPNRKVIDFGNHLDSG
jgi:hypothetical protein